MLDRRQFLRRSGAAAITAGALGAASCRESTRRGDPARPPSDPLQADGPLQYAVAADPAARLPAVPFHGRWQAGIVNPPPPAACFVSFNVTAANRGELIDLLQTLTARARFLTEGGVPANHGPVAPPSDSGTLGPEIPADGLTVTVGFGSTLFDDRFGIAARKPKHLTPMTSFPNDDLNPNLCGGDLLLQICAGSTDTAIHALRDIAKHTRGGMQILWRMDGFVSPARPAGRPAQPLRLHGRDRQPERHRCGGREPAAVGGPGDRRARLGGRRQLPRLPDHPACSSSSGIGFR